MEPFSLRSNMTTRGVARGGRLVFDGDVLSFGNHKADRALTGTAEWSTPLAAVERADVVKGSFAPREWFSGGMRTRLRIRAGGEERLFVVGNAARLAADLDAAARERRGR